MAVVPVYAGDQTDDTMRQFHYISWSIHMWLFTRYGFYSVACAQKKNGSVDLSTMMVRARRKSHLQVLQKRFAQLEASEIVLLPGRDYKYRLFVAKDSWAEIVAELASEQEWSNFKNEAARFGGAGSSDYVRALHEVWATMNDLQRREPSGETTPKCGS